MLKPFNELPEDMQNEKVKKYYDVLAQKKGQLALKRIFDVTVAGVMTVLVSPVLIGVAVWIKSDSEGPVFYRQERITQYGKTFRIFKFRTMVSNADKIGSLVTTQNDSRITKVGEKIRKCRLDELPQLFNIIAGDMSFVGTRPEVKKYVDRYSNEMKATLLLPAGVTSKASIKFKDEDKLLAGAQDIDETYVKVVLPKKMKYNLNDIKRFSFMREIGIMVQTVLAVLDGDD